MTEGQKLLAAWAGLYAAILVCGIGATIAAIKLYQIAHAASLTAWGR